ncbi:hypothetical protein D3C81_176290 [compost metagenome]
MQGNIEIVNLKEPVRVATDAEVDQLLRDQPTPDLIKRRDHSTVAIMAHIEANRLEDGTFAVYDHQGIYTKWCRHIRNTIVPDADSKVHEILVKDAFVYEGRNAMGPYERVVFRTASRFGFGKVLFLERMGFEEDAPVRLACADGWANLPALPADAPLPVVIPTLAGTHLTVFTEPSNMAVLQAGAQSLM